MSRTAKDRYGAGADDIAALTALYGKHGFVAARGVLSAAEIAEFRPAIDAAVAARAGRDPRAFDERSPYEQSFRQCIHLWVDNPAVRPLDFHPKIAGLAASLLGAK